MGFSPSDQTALNVGSIIKCVECKKPRLMYSKRKLSDDEKGALKRFLPSFENVCGSSFREVPDGAHPNKKGVRMKESLL